MKKTVLAAVFAVLPVLAAAEKPHAGAVLPLVYVVGKAGRPRTLPATSGTPSLTRGHGKRPAATLSRQQTATVTVEQSTARSPRSPVSRTTAPSALMLVAAAAGLVWALAAHGASEEDGSEPELMPPDTPKRSS